MNEVQRLLEIERKYAKFNDTIDGFTYWTFARYEIIWDIIKQRKGYGEAHSQGSISLMRKLRMFINAAVRGKCSARNIDILVLNHERRVYNGKEYECIYTDEVVQRMGNAVVVERPYRESHFTPIPTPNIIYTDAVEIGSTVRLLLYRFVRKRKHKEIKKAVEQRIALVCTKMCEALDVENNLTKYVDLIADLYVVYGIKRKYYEKVICKYCPKAIMEVVSYNFDCMVVNEIAHDKGIPTIELQHGTTGKEHWAYNYPSGIRIRQFPDYFFAFSEFWCQGTEYPIPEKNRKSVGFPHLDKCATGLPNKMQNSEKKIILFISQGTVGELLSNMAIELNNVIDRKRYKIIYKLHPGEYAVWRERYPYLQNSEIEVVDNNKIDLYSLFQKSFCQIGTYGSTATFEGLYFNVLTFIYEPAARSFLRDLWEQGYAQKFTTIDELRNLVENGDRNNKRQSDNSFWVKGALDNIIRETRKIIEDTHNNSEMSSSDKVMEGL